MGTIFRAAIFTAIEVEYNAVLAHLATLTKHINQFDGSPYRVGRLPSTRAEIDTDWEIAVVRTGDGQTAATAETQLLILDFKPHVALFVGVAGGRPGKVAHGDIVIASEVAYYESGKDSSPTSQETQFHFRPKVHYPDGTLRKTAEFESFEGKWRDRLPARPNVEVHCAPIASGEKVVASEASALWKGVENQFDKVIAVEMEGHGFHFAQQGLRVPGMVVRGISDLLGDKNATSEEDDDTRQEFASNNVAAFVIEIISNLAADVYLSQEKQSAPSAIVIIAIESSSDQVGHILHMLADLTNDANISLKSVNVGSIILTAETRPTGAALVRSAYMGGLLSELLGKSVTSVSSEVARTGIAKFDLMLEKIESIKDRGEDIDEIVSDLESFILENPAWKSSFMLIRHAALRTKKIDPTPSFSSSRAGRGVRLRRLESLVNEMGISRKQLAYASGVSAQTASRAVLGYPIMHFTAHRILRGLNEIRSRDHMTPVEISGLL